MTRTPNADKLNASLRTSTRKRKTAPTIILSDEEADSDYKEVLVVESEDDFVEWKEDEELKVTAKRTTRERTASLTSTSAKRVKKATPIGVQDDIEEAPLNWRPHGGKYHDDDRVVALTDDLLQWFQEVREKRAMPWRKVYKDELSMEEKGQRAYEIWVSEVMLQQTQVTTVIPYWKKWMETWPTIADLATADVEDVNSAWKGLGYYRRARSLLSGAKKVMSDPKYQGRLPDIPAVLEKEIDGIGRYTAGAICSMAYGVRTPIVDGNIHRLLCRLLALHAPATSPILLKKLWSTAQKLVDSLQADGAQAGDLNQALMELGSQICKPSNPDCGNCPLRAGCNAYSELTTAPAIPDKDACDICVPPPDLASVQEASVTIYPMKKVAKAPKEQSTAVCLVEWRSGDGDLSTTKWLFVKRPDKGLLAGLFEPPSTIVDSVISTGERIEKLCVYASSLFDTPQEVSSATDAVKKMQDHGYLQDYVHVFSHIRMTYHVHRLLLHTSTLPQLSSFETETTWMNMDEIAAANVTTGAKNILKALYDPPQLQDAKKKPVARKAKPKAVSAEGGKKVVKVIKMPGT